MAGAVADPKAAAWADDPRLATVGMGETVRAASTSGAFDLAALPLMTLSERDPAADGDGAPQGSDVEIVGVLGAGGMGEVCLARQASLGREVAVKRAPRQQDPAYAAALVREGRLTGMLEHPNVVPVHALGRDASGAPFFVMKRVEGVSFGEVLHARDHGAWTDLLARHGDRWGVVVEVLTQVSNALSFAHARGVIHRDVKPDNVMLGAYGEVYLVDWGIAMERALGPAKTLVGTPGYMAPEMVDPTLGPTDERTDVYLLGATLHEALVGAARHDRESAVAAILAALASEPYAYPPEVPAELAELANAATARDRALRPPSAAAFREGIARFTRHRASRALGDAAAAALAAVSEDRESSPASARRRFRALSEARFGFRQALREWPGNLAARAGLREALTRMIDHELAVESPESARALYEELRESEVEAGDVDTTRDAELLAAVARVEEALAARRARDAGIDRLRRDMDAAPTAATRAAGFGVLGLGVLVFAGLVFARGGGKGFGATQLFAMDFAGAALFGLLVLAARERLFVNEMGRRLTWAALLQGGYFAAADLLAVVRGGTASEALAHRALGIACAFGTTAVLMLPSSRWQAIYMSAAAFAVAALPEPAAVWVGLGALLGLIALSSVLFVTGRVALRRGDVLGE